MDMSTSQIPTNLEQITGHDADELFLIAVEGQDASQVQHISSHRDPATGFTWTRTAGAYGDGQDCTGWHVRDADGEFVDLIADRS